jgi:hypothetical protein
VEAMCKIANDPNNDVQIRLAASKELAQYMYPKLRSIEHNHNNDGLKIVRIIDMTDNLHNIDC